VRAGAVAGTLAPPLFGAVVAGLTLHELSFLRAVGWDPVRRTDAGWPSVLALSGDGGVQVAAFAVCGALGMPFALALARAVPRGLATVGAALVGLLAVAVGLGAFEPDPPGARGSTWHGAIHDVVYPMVAVCGIAAAAALAAGLWRDGAWRGQARLAAAATLALGVGMALQAVRPIGQLAEYLFFGPLLVWLELLAVGLLVRVRRGWRVAGRRPSGDSPSGVSEESR
jgi:hypothetical protein